MPQVQPFKTDAYLPWTRPTSGLFVFRSIAQIRLVQLSERVAKVVLNQLGEVRVVKEGSVVAQVVQRLPVQDICKEGVVNI